MLDADRHLQSTQALHALLVANIADVTCILYTQQCSLDMQQNSPFQSFWLLPLPPLIVICFTGRQMLVQHAIACFVTHNLLLTHTVCLDQVSLHCSGQSYLLHVETINLLLVLSSTQLYSTSASAPLGNHPFIDALMQQQPLAAQMVQHALQHYSTRPPLPPKLQLWSPSTDGGDKGVLKLVRSAAGEHMTLSCC